MRNLKRVLSLTLASVMLLGMMVIGASASAADYNDVDDNDNVEAIDVLTAVGVFEGYDDGLFHPDDLVTRAQMAKIMTLLTNLNTYVTGSNPFPDVPNWAQDWVSYCYVNGIIKGYDNGYFGSDDPVTAVQAAAMLMRALGYFKYDVDYADGFEVSTIRQAGRINLFDRVGTSSASDNMTRNQVAQIVLNALQCGMVEPDNGTNLSVTTPDGFTVATGATNYVYMVARDNNVGQAINKTRADNGNSTAGLIGYVLDLGEQLYNGELKLHKDTIDVFGAPSRTWEYKGQEIGTYAKVELLRGDGYTKKVTGKDLYDLLTRNVIDEYSLAVYVDGAPVTFDINDLVRTNEAGITSASRPYNSATLTGNGVLTEVYVDTEAKEITLVIVNTWLARATTDYNTNTGTVNLEVYRGYGASDTISSIKSVDSEDFPMVADLKKDDLVLVQWADESLNPSDKVIERVGDVADTITDVPVTQFSKDGTDYDEKNSDGNQGRVTSITAEGTKYDANAKAFYEHGTLYEYYGELLTNKTYDIYLDQYGYFIGAKLHSGTDQYVFISAADVSSTALGNRNADALAIFTDGTLATIKVNVSDTNKNINNLRAQKLENGDPANAEHYHDAAYDPWAWNGVAGTGTTTINRWFTYTEDNGVYTLNPVKRYAYDETTVNEEITVESDRISLIRSRVEDGVGHAVGNAYGNDNSIYITTDLMKADKGNFAVDEVTGLYTGVQSVKLTYGYSQPLSNGLIDPNSHGWISAVYDSSNNIIAAVMNGTAEGSTENYAYILDGAKTESSTDEYYRWTFDAVLAGEKQTLTIKSRFSNTVMNLKKNEVQELIFDADGNVTTIRDVPNYTTAHDANCLTANYYNDKVFDIGEYLHNEATNTATSKVVHLLSDYSVWHIASTDLVAGSGGVQMTVKGGSLHFQGSTGDDRGLAIASGAKAVVKHYVNNTSKTENYGSVSDAYDILNDANDSNTTFEFWGDVWAVLDSQGRASWVFFNDYTNPFNRGNYTGGGSGNVTSTVSSTLLTGLSGTAEISAYGVPTMTFTATAPAWAAGNANLTYAVYVNNKLLGTDTQSIAVASDKSITRPISTFTGMTATGIIDPNSTIRVEITGVSYTRRVVQYVDVTNDTTVETVATTNYTIETGTKSLTFTVDTTAYTPASLASATYVYGGVATGTGGTGVGSPVNNTVTVSGNGYVTVSITGLAPVAPTYKLTIQGENTFANVALSESSIGVHKVDGLITGLSYDAATEKLGDFKITVTTGGGNPAIIDKGTSRNFKFTLTNDATRASGLYQGATIEYSIVNDKNVKIGGDVLTIDFGVSGRTGDTAVEWINDIQSDVNLVIEKITLKTVNYYVTAVEYKSDAKEIWVTYNSAAALERGVTDGSITITGGTGTKGSSGDFRTQGNTLIIPVSAALTGDEVLDINGAVTVNGAPVKQVKITFTAESDGTVKATDFDYFC